MNDNVTNGIFEVIFFGDTLRGTLTAHYNTEPKEIINKKTPKFDAFFHNAFEAFILR